MGDVQKVVKDLSFAFYADLAIDRIKHAKTLYEESVDNTSIIKIKKCHRDILDSKYLYRELEQLIKQTKTNILNLRKQDLT